MMTKQPHNNLPQYTSSDTHTLTAPELKHHKGTGQAYVNVSKRRVYLGRWGLSETQRRYHAFMAEFLASGGHVRLSNTNATIATLVEAFRTDATGRYNHRSRSQKNELTNYNTLLSMLEELYGPVPVEAFTARHLKAVRQTMIRRGWVRTHINREVVRARTVFKWGVAEGLVPAQVLTSLQALQGLREGQVGVHESEPVRALTDAQVGPVIEAATDALADMIRVQLRTGMRPGELCSMRPIDIDTSGDVWMYTPATHKTKHAGKCRVIAIGPEAQRILQRYLIDRRVDAPIFSPTESEVQRLAKRHTQRTTYITCGNRPGTNRVRNPKRRPGEGFTTTTYARAVSNACTRAFPAPESLKGDKRATEEWHKTHRWSPNKLRHTAATRIRKEFGLEAARVILGHSMLGVTEQFYAERDLGAAKEVARKIG